MRAVITPVNDHQYQAHFHAFYKKVLTFSYTIVLDAVGPAEDVQLTGEADLGKLAGGVYRYEGRATPVDFTCKYSSKYDIGTFTLHRVPLAK